MGAPPKADWREERRKRAWDLKQQGWKQQAIALALGGSSGAVSQWLKRGRAGGREALSAHPSTGAAPWLSVEQKAQIPGWLAEARRGVRLSRGGVDRQPVAQLIYQRFGVRYHRDHVGRLLREAGWSRQHSIECASASR